MPTGPTSLLVGIYFGVAEQQDTSATTVAQRGANLMTWVTSADDPAQARARATLVERCFDRLAGQDIDQPADVQGQKWSATKAPWYRSAETAAWVALVAGLITAALAFIGSNDTFRFQHSPDG